MSKDLIQWCNEDLYPAIFANLPSVFDEFGWKPNQAGGWKATKSPLSCRADRIICNKPFGFLVHGEGEQHWLAYMNKGTFPKGEEWIQVVKDLAQRVGMSLPEKNLSPEARARMEAKKKAGEVVEEMVQLCHRLLLESKEAEEARTYLEARGLPRDRWEVWELGFMPKSTAPIVKGLEAKGWKWEEAKAILLEAGILAQKDGKNPYPHLFGRVVAPWRGSGESILGWWGRKLTDEKPKYLYTPGNWRSRPYLLDRSIRGERLLIVEGVLDAIQCREYGFPAVAMGGLGLMDVYLSPLKASFPQSVVLALDPDEKGVKGIPTAIQKLLKEGFDPFVLKLPKGEKGEKGDPDEFLRTHGPDAFRRLVDEAPSALRWKARDILATHGAAGWNDQNTVKAIREAQLFSGKLPAAIQPFLRSLFWDELAQEIPISIETMKENTMALSEEEERESRENATRAKAQEPDFKAPRVAPRVVLEELAEHEAHLNKFRGKDRVGMTQETLPGLDKALLGLRGLMLLAGPPNCGKTSLAVQLGLGVLEIEEKAVVVILSLEQKRFEHLSRIKAHLSELDWKTVTMGSNGLKEANREPGTYFTRDDFAKLQGGKARLRDIGDRLLILDDENFPKPTAENILQEMEALKIKTGATKALLVVDYLQLWPVPLDQAKVLRTDLDKDKWQVGALKKLKNRMGDEDAVIAISEAKKEAWEKGLGMDSIMGSARGVYTPDVVITLQPLPDEDHATGTKNVSKTGGSKKRDELAESGKALMRLRIIKGRDGVQRGSFDLVFFHTETRFEETTFSDHL